MRSSRHPRRGSKRRRPHPDRPHGHRPRRRRSPCTSLRRRRLGPTASLVVPRPVVLVPEDVLRLTDVRHVGGGPRPARRRRRPSGIVPEGERHGDEDDRERHGDDGRDGLPGSTAPPPSSGRRPFERHRRLYTVQTRPRGLDERVARVVAVAPLFGQGTGDHGLHPRRRVGRHRRRRVVQMRVDRRHIGGAREGSRAREALEEDAPQRIHVRAPVDLPRPGSVRGPRSRPSRRTGPSSSAPPACPCAS